MEVLSHTVGQKAEIPLCFYDIGGNFKELISRESSFPT